MKTKNKKLTLEQWESKYMPMITPTPDDSNWGGTMFETYGAEYAIVAATPDERVWTWVESDTDDSTYLCSGFHFVNRIGYFVCEVAYYDEGACIKVD